MSKPWQFVEALTIGHQERYSRAVRKMRHDLQFADGELEYLEDLPHWEWRGAFLRCVIEAGWITTEGVTPDSVVDLTPGEADEYIEMAGELFRDAKEVDPT